MTDPMHPSRDELLSDLTYWAASPRVPEKVQLLLLEVMGRLTRSETQRTIECLCPKCGVKHGGLSEAQ